MGWLRKGLLLLVTVENGEIHECHRVIGRS
jgi:hypothetical protein